MPKPHYSPEKEYEALRTELLGAKKYVLERPILIVTAALASIQIADEKYALFLSIILLFLMWFNLWFTINRMGSIARIVAYIQIVLENNETPWFGWETSLRMYRKFLKKENLNVRKIQVDQDSVYDNLGYFPVIYYMHIGVVWATVITAFYYGAWQSNEIKNYGLVGFSIISGLVFTFYVYANRPSKIKPQIEQNRKIWNNAFLGSSDL